jgi:hypothetical protein
VPTVSVVHDVPNPAGTVADPTKGAPIVLVVILEIETTEPCTAKPASRNS